MSLSHEGLLNHSISSPELLPRSPTVKSDEMVATSSTKHARTASSQQLPCKVYIGNYNIRTDPVKEILPLLSGLRIRHYELYKMFMFVYLDESEETCTHIVKTLQSTVINNRPLVLRLI